MSIFYLPNANQTGLKFSENIWTNLGKCRINLKWNYLLLVEREHDGGVHRSWESNIIKWCSSKGPFQYPSAIIWSFCCGIHHLQSKFAFNLYSEKLWNLQFPVHGLGPFFKYHSNTQNVLSTDSRFTPGYNFMWTILSTRMYSYPKNVVINENHPTREIVYQIPA